MFAAIASYTALLIVSSASSPPSWIFPVLLLAFGATGAWLQACGKDPRTRYLGVVYILVGAIFCEPALSSSRQSFPAFEWWFSFLLALPPEAFLPFFFALFAGTFPRVVGPVNASGGRDSPPAASGFQSRESGSGWLPTLLFVASVLLFLPNALAVVVSVDWLPGALLLLEPDSEATSGYFWPVLFLLLPPSVAAAIIRIFRETIRSFRKSGKGPRRKLLFFGAIVMCIVPIFIALLLQRASPLFDRFVRREPPFDVIANIIVYGGLLSMPAAAIYAVAVLRVLEVRAVVGPLIERMARFLRREEYDLEKTLAKVRPGFRHSSPPTGCRREGGAPGIVSHSAARQSMLSSARSGPGISDSVIRWTLHR